MLIFFNFLALPSVAAVFGFEIPQTNVTVSEEETHTAASALFEKVLPRTLSIYDFLNFTDISAGNDNVLYGAEDIHLSPFLSIFSPPPEA